MTHLNPRVNQSGPAEARSDTADRSGGVMGRGVRLPITLLGIPLILDWSFLIVLPLMAYLIGSNVEVYARLFGIPGADLLGGARWILGLTAALGLFVCVILHELGHAVTARLYKIEVKNITLWFLGGMAHIAEMPRRRGGEAVVALVGPIVSFAIGALMWAWLRAAPPASAGGQFLVAYLAVVNVMLGAFNLLPALPLDGGRILRSLLALAMPHVRATRATAVVSKVVAVGLGLLGLMGGNLFLLFIAFFIFIGVQGETRQSVASNLLDGLSVGDLMSRDVKSVHPWLGVADLTSIMLDERHLGFPVVDEGGRLVGMVSLRELTTTPRPRPGALVRDVMVHEPPLVREDAPAESALQRLGTDTMNRLIVIDAAGNVVGIVTGADLMRAIQVRALGEGWRRAA
jgi:Zn-dependent protease/predicted transcriptional regulator